MEQLKLVFQFKHKMLPTDILNLFKLNSVASSQCTRNVFNEGLFVPRIYTTVINRLGTLPLCTIFLKVIRKLILLRWMVCEKIVIFFNFIKIAKHTYSYAKFIVNSISENRFYLSCLKHEIFAFFNIW